MTTQVSDHPDSTDGVRLFGIRHHGPGSARSLVAALDAYGPDLVLVEGPPEGEAALSWVSDPGLVPPVALFAYEVGEAANSVFWPFAVFSPEWQALAWAARRQVTVHFMDLPAAVMLALSAQQDAAGESPDEDSASTPPEDPSVRRDPFSVLAEIAGIDDTERWWDEVVESTPDGDRFAAVAQMMVQLRSAYDASDDARGNDSPAARREAAREAQMRTVLRQARRQASRVAVVCGAWHVPALTEPLPPAKQDAAILKGLPKVKCEMAWVPWTHSRLAEASGYGAGVPSPGWYHHLFTTTDQPVVRWLTKVAGVLRDRDLPVSSAHIIEATRLAQTLSALRGRSLPGLGEVTEAVRSVMCDGNDTMVGFVNRELVVGEQLGAVPEGAPLVPLETDLRSLAKTLRLAFQAVDKELTLDLRKDFDLRRSVLLHRLAVLGIDWGRPRAENSTGTFKEAWTLAWEPQFAIAIVEASGWGTTVASAAARKLGEQTDSVAVIAAAIEQALVADLGQTLQSLLVALDQRAAAEGDLLALLASVPPLARAARYGTVRGTDTSALTAVAESILVRAASGLAGAVAGLDADAARDAAPALDETQRAVRLLPGSGEIWAKALQEVADRRDAPALLVGKAVRLLFDQGALDREEVGTRLSRALSPGHIPADQAGWIEGLLAGDALLLIHDDHLIAIIDRWVRDLDDEAFQDCVPLVRRTFGSFQRPERRQLELQVRQLGQDGLTAAETGSLDLAAAAAALVTVRALLGWKEQA